MSLSTHEILALSIFVIVYFFIISEIVHRTIIALLGAAVMIMSGILTQAKAISYVDFNTIGLLVGMMLIVNITSETGVFNFMALWSAQKVKARPLYLMGALALLTAVCSGFLDNVTTVLLTVPVTFSICKKLKIPVYPFLLVQIMASNIGGTATAPVLAGTYSSALVPVGVIMALLGYVVGTGGGLLVAQIMSAMA